MLIVAEILLSTAVLSTPQGLSNSAWAFAKLGFSSPILFEALAEAAAGKLEGFTPQGLSNTAWAYATVGHYHPGLMKQLAEQVSRAYSLVGCEGLVRYWGWALFAGLTVRLRC